MTRTLTRCWMIGILTLSFSMTASVFGAERRARYEMPRKVTDISNLKIRTCYGSTDTCNHMIRDIFCVWWDKKFDYSEGAKNLLDSLVLTRAYCLDTFAMADPKGADKYYYNVYIHNGKDLFPDRWAQGQGTDRDGFPYLTIPAGLTDPSYTGHVHEGFHIHQYNANSPGFAYRGDSAWFIEATANWFVSIRYPEKPSNFICGGAVTSNPHVPMWYSFRNKESGDKNNWQRDCHQYGMNILCYYLTEVGKVPRELMANGFFAECDESPQEYLYRQIGPAKMCELFADWAAHNAADFDYLTPEQVKRLHREYASYGTPDDATPIVKTFDNTGTGGQWFRPGEDCVTRGWGYNVYKINNTDAARYTFTIEGDDKGSDDAKAEFRARVVVRAGDKRSYHHVELSDDQQGAKAIRVSPSDGMIFLVVAATPENFEGNQKYSYRIKIDKADVATE